uniref:Uncharacterized protein n=1 Tax=Opuntia streptacantha TaxID=393608 RepID=A0A7C8YMJ8_OPUST
MIAIPEEILGVIRTHWIKLIAQQCDLYQSCPTAASRHFFEPIFVRILDDVIESGVDIKVSQSCIRKFRGKRIELRIEFRIKELSRTVVCLRTFPHNSSSQCPL